MLLTKNTLQFEVQNAFGPTGLDVSSSPQRTVAESSTLSIAVLGLFGLLVAWRARMADRDSAAALRIPSDPPEA